VIAAKCRVPPVAAHRPVFVSATAGAGKTTAVIQALDRVDLPTAWLTLDETDAAPGRLLTYLEATLASAVPGVAGVVAAALRRRLPHREAAGLLAEATAGSPVILVVDELERLAAAPEALGVLGAFVRYAPPGLRLVLVGRETVALELPSEAAIGGAAGIGETWMAIAPLGPSSRRMRRASRSRKVAACNSFRVAWRSNG
jgi:ATP/maltotriose-dependent transcriptional regulator MalT